ncbi:2-oxoadipate dioxygenase/decarboxylase HglS [Sulfitobacter donghicola]|uniref:2-oxoadipate dioxygenase/decarboxylase n=1 Tax=Sulfitobacter donghicola DSW-25 = KCTC 12864 = JCM 14565 TaxID=1300350 RepID=A0A073IEF6_9RHOB|nr:VOC family protein [Sulfitobacter donghicola]KEJ87876.1 hypothetical protein DSW25_04460 [Sulfitobacter donghicola DSW-25 = KCTC 12864 = JCM 14565]KIN67277.1 DUF1338 domain containing protein [Sulfitobacter donghicola DSW-25 = KCTC 12864 = JCM 14565]
MSEYVSPSKIRSMFSQAMSTMYRDEVPAYSDLLEIVETTNNSVLKTSRAADLRVDQDEDLDRISDERHGAIRVGTASELSMIRRIFAVMGMVPVGYYDLGVAGIPVHSTAFRPIDRDALAQNPFRVFTSLLRLELIEDEALRAIAQSTLSARNIFTPRAIALTELAEENGGLNASETAEFVQEVLETFRWAEDAIVTEETYKKLHDAHRLIADVVGFQGPHINHLTPRTLDIDAAQQEMIERKLPAKAIVEGPPKRDCPILLRQTSFKALDEKVKFVGAAEQGTHTARFGEIEERGVALTPKGRALYDRLLSSARAKVQPNPDGSNAAAYLEALSAAFAEFPDDWRMLHDQELAYFRYSVVGEITSGDLNGLLDAGVVQISPIIYEDFLPVSAAGIFQSNLGDDAAHVSLSLSSRDQFVAALGAEPADEFAVYEAIQNASLAKIPLRKVS